jgi:hypothetical protein
MCPGEPVARSYLGHEWRRTRACTYSLALHTLHVIKTATRKVARISTTHAYSNGTTAVSSSSTTAGVGGVATKTRGNSFTQSSLAGCWSENLFVRGVDAHGEFYAIPFGPSGTAPAKGTAGFEEYFTKLRTGGFGNGTKSPDLLVFSREDADEVAGLVGALGGASEIAFTDLSHPIIERLLAMAIIAVECETSSWYGRMMKNYGESLRPMRRMGGKPGLPVGSKVPRIIAKAADIDGLVAWERETGVAVHIWHHFHDVQFGISLSTLRSLIRRGLTEKTTYMYSGEKESKPQYHTYYHYAYTVGTTVEKATLHVEEVVEESGHIAKNTYYEGGSIALSDECLGVLRGGRAH